MGIISNSKSSASGCCLAFAWFFANFSVALPISANLSELTNFYSLGFLMISKGIGVN